MADVKRETANVNNEDLEVIAAYEMYCALEMRTLQPLTDTYLDGLPEKHKMLMDRYCAAKLNVLFAHPAITFETDKSIASTKNRRRSLLLMEKDKKP